MKLLVMKKKQEYQKQQQKNYYYDEVVGKKKKKNNNIKIKIIIETSKLDGVDATIIILVFVLYCIVLKQQLL